MTKSLNLTKGKTWKNREKPWEEPCPGTFKRLIALLVAICCHVSSSLAAMTSRNVMVDRCGNQQEQDTRITILIIIDVYSINKRHALTLIIFSLNYCIMKQETLPPPPAAPPALLDEPLWAQPAPRLTLWPRRLAPQPPRPGASVSPSGGAGLARSHRLHPTPRGQPSIQLLYSLYVGYIAYR